MAEADILPEYERARAAAEEARANGMLSQVVLPGEMGFEDFRRLNLMPGRGLGVQRNFAGDVSMPMTIAEIGQQNRALFQNQLTGFADGGPVERGLGSFLASNIDEFGRNGDTEVIHATKSEVVLPKGMVDNPEVRRTVRDLFEQTGRDMQEYTVGSGEMNVNPMTGYEEAFDLIGRIKDTFKKAAPVLLPIATTFLFPGMSPFLSGALAGGVGSLIQGGSIEDAFKAGIQGGLTSAATTSLMKGSFSAGFKGSENYKPFEMRRFGEAAPTTPVTLESKTQQVLQDPTPAYDKAKGFFMNEGTAAVPPQYPDLQAAMAANPALDPNTAGGADLLKTLTTGTAGTPASMNFGRTVAGGLGALALAGGFDEIPAEEIDDAYPYSSRELMEMYPERYRTGPVIAPTRLPYQTQFAAKGGEMEFPRRQGYIAGPGTETSDDIPAMLSDGEFVMTARAVRGAGDGSRKAGVNKMYDIMRAFEGGVVS